MPGRYLREGWLDSDRIRGCGDGAEVLLLRLILVADDFGRFDGRPTVILRKCWPVGDDDGGFPAPSRQEIEARLEVLTNQGLVIPYTAAAKPYLLIPNFKQRTRAAKSKFPDPPANVGQVSDKRPAPDGQGAGRWRAPVGAPRAGSVSGSVYDNAMSDKRPTPAPVDKSEGPKPIAAAAAKALEEARATAAKAPPADPERIPDPKPTLARRPANGKLPEDWAHSAEGIEHAAASLGIARLDFEDDAALVARINTTLHLFQ